MANNPNDTNPLFPPDDAPRRPAKKPEDQDSFDGLDNLDDLDLAALPDDAELTEPEHTLPPADSNLPDIPGEELTVPDAVPASEPGLSSTHVGDGGPVAPVAPDAGWLDEPTEVDADPLPRAAPLNVERADPDGYGEPPAPAVESSDIFSNSPLPMADRAESSDVIAATASGGDDAFDGGKPSRPSDVLRSLGIPPGSSGSLPIADEVSDTNLPTAAPFDSGQLGRTPEPSAAGDRSSIHSALRDSPDFGARPDFTPDASSILADLSDPDASAPGDSSAIPLESPGGGRSYPSDPSDPSAGSGFDLTVAGGPAPAELDEAEAEAAPKPPSSDLFAGSRHSSAELNLDFVASDADSGTGEVPIMKVPSGSGDSFSSASPSSIFSEEGDAAGAAAKADSGKVPLGSAPAKGETGSDSSVEFSDHPEAEDEAAASRIFGSANPSSRVTGRARPSDPEADLGPPSAAARTNQPDDGVIDWDLTTGEDDSSASGPHGRSSASSGRLGRHEPKPEHAEEPTLPDGRMAVPGGAGSPGKPKSPSRSETGTSSPSVEIDWIAGSAGDEEVPVIAGEETTEPTGSGGSWDPDAPTRESKVSTRAKDRPKEPAARPAKAEREKPQRERGGKGGWVGGTLLGMVIAGGGFAGAYFGGLIPNGENTTATRPTGQQPGPGGNVANTGAGGSGAAAAPTAADVAAAVRAGNPAKAKEIAAAIGDETPAGKAAAGEAQLFALVQGSKGDTPIAADHPDLQAARANLQALVDDADAAKTPEGERAAVKAAVQLGISHELAGDVAAARKVYQDAAKKFPNHAATFEAALDRLAATAAPAAAPPAPSGEGTSRRLDPADARQLLLAVTLLQADGKADDAEAGVHFWKAVNRATANSFTEAIEEIGKAMAAHVKQAKANAGRGLNPLSDPLEQIFPRCCDDLKAYWELRAAIYSQKPIAELVKKDGAAKAMAELAGAQKKAADAVTLMAEVKDKTDKLKAAGDKLNEVTKTFEAAEKALKEEKDLVAKLQKDAGDMKLAFEKKLEAETQARKKTEKEYQDVLGERNTSASLIRSIVQELKFVKLLPPKFDPKDAKDRKTIEQAVRTAAQQSTGPNLSALLPKGMVAVGGGLSSGQLVGIADRLAKAEAGAKAAREKYEADAKKLNDSHAAALKQMTDSYNENIKKITATNAENAKRLKDEQAAALKKASDKYAADAKKLGDDFQAKVKEAEAVAAKEKERGEAMAAQFKKDLGNAISPAQALDIWLPLLVELRRPSDAAPALATAEKVIASAPADSEDAAKARTVAGLALLYKGESAAAKLQFQAALSNPTHAAARKAKKLWATAAEVGLASVADPLAPYRQPVELPKRDAALAARYLDAGVKAYRDGRYEEARTALENATKAEPGDPVAWYFLGAAKWALGSTDQAKDDFRQGSVREAAADVSTRAVSEAISPIQGPARDALTASRP
jgi:hypothetical protein